MVVPLKIEFTGDWDSKQINIFQFTNKKEQSLFELRLMVGFVVSIHLLY